MRLRSLALPLLAVLAVLAVAAPLSAQTIVNHWRFGESDSGAASGNTFGATTTATVGAANLTVTGTITYSNDVVGSGSSLSASLGSGAQFSSAVRTDLTSSSSFIMEVWFNPTTATGSRLLIYNGNASTSGIGILLSGANLDVLRGGRADGVVSGYNLNQWNYTALVFDGAANSIKVFVNGVTTAAYTFSGDVTFNEPTDEFTIGSGFSGSVDEARISTFATGTFNTSMLSYNSMSAIPEPSTYAALVGACALGFAAHRRRRRA